MAWQSTLPADPVVAGWWCGYEEREEAERRAAAAADRPEWRVPALAARVRRALRDIDRALAPACGCLYDHGSLPCLPGGDRHHARSAPDHGVQARFAGEIEHSAPRGRVLGVH